MRTTAPRLCAFGMGLIIIIIGVLGYLTQFTVDGMLFGLFEVDSIHNLIHIITGALGIIAAIPARRRYAAWYVLEMGIIYGIVTVLGFALNGEIYNLTYFNLNDNILHAGITIAALLLTAILAATEPEQFIRLPGWEAR